MIEDFKMISVILGARSSQGTYQNENLLVVIQLSSFRVAIGVSNIIDHTLTKWPIINQFLFFLTVLASPVKFFANTIETDNLEHFLFTLYIDQF